MSFHTDNSVRGKIGANELKHFVTSFIEHFNGFRQLIICHRRIKTASGTGRQNTHCKTVHLICKIRVHDALPENMIYGYYYICIFVCCC